MALAVTDDHATQEKVWAELPTWNRHPSTIRRLLTQAHFEASDRLAVFVGVETYVAAGGAILRDLFEEEHEGYLTNPALLDRLASERLEREAEAVRTEGWKLVELNARPRLRGTQAVPPRPSRNAAVDRSAADQA